MIRIFKFLNAIAIGLFLLISFSAVAYLYEKRAKINRFFLDNVVNRYETRKSNDLYWAKEIMNGGYILHFRHAERDKWIDVKMYDALESHLHSNGDNESRYAENDYFSEAVCLNNRGKIQAKRRQNKGKAMAKQRQSEGKTSDRYFAPSWAMLGPSQDHLGTSLAILSDFGALLQQLWSNLGPSWPNLLHLGAILGLLLGQLGAILCYSGPSCAILEPS